MLHKKNITIILVFMLLASCSSAFPFSATPTPEPTFTFAASPTLTFTPTSTVTPTKIPTSLPTSTVTALPVSDTVQSRDQFEEMVRSGAIHCRGYKSIDTKFLNNYMKEARKDGALVSENLLLVSGLPSSQKPTLCLFVMFFEDDYSYIVYKDSGSEKFIRLLMLE